MNLKTILTISFLVMLTVVLQAQPLHKVVNRQFGFTLKIPAACVQVADTFQSIESELYYDTTAGIILMISRRQSQFTTVDQYINCGIEGLEKLLRSNFGDSTLTLLSCNKPGRYSRQTNVLHFRVSVLPMGYDSYVIYFIHHHNADIQISFTYKQINTTESIRYIEAVMATLRLK